MKFYFTTEGIKDTRTGAILSAEFDHLYIMQASEEDGALVIFNLLFERNKSFYLATVSYDDTATVNVWSHPNALPNQVDTDFFSLPVTEVTHMQDLDAVKQECIYVYKYNKRKFKRIRLNTPNILPFNIALFGVARHPMDKILRVVEL